MTTEIDHAPLDDTVPAALLIMAKSPIPGFAKTRLTPQFSPVDAAYLAACALLDTLDAVRESGIRHPVVAWTGDLDRAERSVELNAALREVTVIPQRGDSFGERLAHAHVDAAEFGVPVLQIGMDTPQADPVLLARSAARLVATGDTVLGPATDGGWWALGLSSPRAAHLLADIPMSTDRTGELTATALRHSGLRVHALPTLTDVDTYADAVSVAAVSRGRFARAVTELVTAKMPVPL
ncbi:TIGR04282 family arsenosugar biosynthesis glycosyltransferase [Nocardia sp. NPDC004340]|uniref:TIGR04282 family arsenosugar biosynthesis glycosyltransferase n=1 Tax=Nocardia sp. CA-136227 TaxID=3239979 RepID=UPI003D97864B